MAKATPSAQSSGQQPKLLDRVRIAIRLKNYSIRTEEGYVAWVERYIRFHKLRHPQEMGALKLKHFSLILRWKAMLPLSRKTRRSVPCSFYTNMC